MKPGQKFCGNCGTRAWDPVAMQRDTFYVRKLPMVMIVFLTLVIIMCVLNVNAYKNIKKYAHEDRPV
ncbi:hypothetical protein [Butyrivibrio sp. FC2001]|uniref:hypothetical protein n=1 Tax=Butyrivibrio sp. FC2001 TaxID=1280671 RepID=UPI0009DBE3F1